MPSDTINPAASPSTPTRRPDRWRIRRGAWRAVAAALLTCSLLAPRDPIVFHFHAGGGHVHSHGDAELLAAIGLEDLARDDHARDHSAHADAGARLTRADDGHYHRQQRFHSAVVPGLIFIAFDAALAPVPLATPPALAYRVLNAAGARAPPLALPA
jgi:hypothetical protein